MTMKIILLFVSFLLSIPAIASEMEMADVHENYKSGSLPDPYGPFSVLLKVSEEDHSVTTLNITVNGMNIPIESDDIDKLKNIDASNFLVGHYIYREVEAPFNKLDPSGKDYLEIRIGSFSGIEKEYTWYGNYFTLLIDLETNSVKLLAVNYDKP